MHEVNLWIQKWPGEERRHDAKEKWNPEYPLGRPIKLIQSRACCCTSCWPGCWPGCWSCRAHLDELGASPSAPPEAAPASDEDEEVEHAGAEKRTQRQCPVSAMSCQMLKHPETILKRVKKDVVAKVGPYRVEFMCWSNV